MDYLRQLLLSETGAGRLDRAALDLARIQFPHLEHEPWLEQINEIAASLGDRLRNFNDGRDFVETAQRYLFGELGFRANDTDFFDPSNSCLNEVLRRRTGIPITLSLVYMEVARRLQMPVYGISLPNRFVVQFDDGRFATFIDPFGGGHAVTPRECFELAGVEAPELTMLARATKKQILMRMLLNLQRAYMQSRDYPQAVATLNYLVEAAPEVLPWRKLRGALLLELKRFALAQADLEAYLAAQPEAPDADLVRQQIQSIRQWSARNN